MRDEPITQRRYSILEYRGNCLQTWLSSCLWKIVVIVARRAFDSLLLKLVAASTPNSSTCHPNIKVVDDPITDFGLIAFAIPEIFPDKKRKMFAQYRYHTDRNFQRWRHHISLLEVYRWDPARSLLSHTFSRRHSRTLHRSALKSYSCPWNWTYNKRSDRIPHVYVEEVYFLWVLVTGIYAELSESSKYAHNEATSGSGWTYITCDFNVPSRSDGSIIGMSEVYKIGLIDKKGKFSSSHYFLPQREYQQHVRDNWNANGQI